MGEQCMKMIESVFKDARLDKRYARIINQLESNVGSSVPQASGTYHQAKAIYRFWDNKRVTTEAILSDAISTTRSKCLQSEVVLCIQDTTDIDFSNLKQTKGLGYLGTEYMLGIKLHAAVAVSGDGLPLGILKERYWERPFEEYGKKKDRKKKEIVQKESYRWVEFQNTLNEELEGVKKLIHICDRESDIYDYLSAERSDSQFILLRIAQDRVVSDESHRIKSYLNNLSQMGRTKVNVGRNGKEAPREAELEVRYGQVKIQCPRDQKKTAKCLEIELTVIKANEIGSEVENPIEWYLATDLEVKTLEEVEQCLEYYSYRWLIERFNYVLKSGCKIEDLQLETSSRLENAIATYTIIAMRILEMTYLSRINPSLYAEEVLSEDEIRLLQMKFKKVQSKEKLLMVDAMIMVAMLGGFMGRKSDGMPGLKTIWRGMFALEMMVEGLNLARAALDGLNFQNNHQNSS